MFPPRPCPMGMLNIKTVIITTVFPSSMKSSRQLSNLRNIIATSCVGSLWSLVLGAQEHTMAHVRRADLLQTTHSNLWSLVLVNGRIQV